MRSSFGKLRLEGRPRRREEHPPRPTVGVVHVSPDPRLVSLVEWAIRAVSMKVYREEYAEWIKWAQRWSDGERSPRDCVDAGRWCFGHKTSEGGVWPSYHALGQIAWAAKESCYTTPTSGWLVVRYIGDAMIAYGIAFPESLALSAPQFPALSSQTVGNSAELAVAGNPHGASRPKGDV